MKFDYCIGNPPYQEEAPGTSTSDLPIYHFFMDAAYKIGTGVELITPARFLFDAGATPSQWNKKMLSDPHLKVLHFESDTKKIFQGVEIPGGIVVTYRNESIVFGEIGQFIQYDQLRSIVDKVQASKPISLNTIMYTQSKFNLNRIYVDYPEMRSQIGNDGKDKRFRQIVMERFPILFKEHEEGDCVRTLGLVQRQRLYRYINRAYVEPECWLDKYKVFVPFSNGASGTLGKEAARMISKPVVGYPKDGITQTFIGVGSFDSESEAINLLKYINSKFCRVLLGVLKVTQGNKPETWAFVPLQDFTSKSDIDWSQSVSEIDRQLYKKYGLSEKEIEFIETHVKEMS
jgi:hypothetical protein